MPQVEAPSICVMDIATGTVLYERNMDEVNYPASITKIMTALLAIENCSLDETVIFSEKAVYGNEGDTSHISRDIDEEMTMEECLYGMMLESANECAWAIGEQVASHGGGTMEQFTKMSVPQNWVVRIRILIIQTVCRTRITGRAHMTWR